MTRFDIPGKKPAFVEPPKFCVIGNGPSALEIREGAVDKFGEVVRFNQYQLRNFSPAVGTKTTVWVKGEEITDSPIPRGAEEFRVVASGSVKGYVSRRIPTIAREVDDIDCPSTGICFLNHLIAMGISPVIAGFDAYNRSRPRNYWDSNWRTAERHSSEQEEAKLIEWHNEGSIILIENYRED